VELSLNLIFVLYVICQLSEAEPFTQRHLLKLLHPFDSTQIPKGSVCASSSRAINGREQKNESGGYADPPTTAAAPVAYPWQLYIHGINSRCEGHVLVTTYYANYRCANYTVSCKVGACTEHGKSIGVKNELGCGRGDRLLRWLKKTISFSFAL
jgi:hypothetical protein